MTSLAVDAFSVCICYGNPTNAIELLEQGRSVFWSQFIRLRSPLDDVAVSGDTSKELADKFTEVASLLRAGSNSPLNTDSQHDFSLWPDIREWTLCLCVQCHWKGYEKLKEVHL